MKRKIKVRLEDLEESLANAEEYVGRNVNVEGKGFLHFDDWKGKSGHPKWMKNHAIPAMKRAQKRLEITLDSIHKKVKSKRIRKRKRVKAT
jgi:hypothetical protein